MKIGVLELTYGQTDAHSFSSMDFGVGGSARLAVIPSAKLHLDTLMSSDWPAAVAKHMRILFSNPVRLPRIKRHIATCPFRQPLDRCGQPCAVDPDLPGQQWGNDKDKNRKPHWNCRGSVSKYTAP